MPEPILQAPVANFSANVQTGVAPLTVVFTNTSTGTINGYAWSFGDGGTSDDKNPTHIFANPGNYSVSLTVFNEAGSKTVVYRIDATSPVTIDAPDRAETIADLIPSIRRMLRGPSDAKLHYRDILDVINDIVRGYSQDLHVSEQNLRTDEAQCTLNHLDGADYILTLPGIQEVEAMQLAFVPQSELQTNPTNVVWREMTIVPLDYYSERFRMDSYVCSFFAGMILDDGVKVKINMAQETIAQANWRVRYRQPMLRLLTLSAKTPLPADFIPMLKTEAVLMCLPRMRDDSKDFYQWRKANEPLFMASITDWRKRWMRYCETNTEPNYVPKTAFNSYRGGSRRRSNYTVTRGTPTS